MINNCSVNNFITLSNKYMSNSKNFVSYVVPAYNCESYIRQAIESAFSQTYSPMEIILSDDCSSDRTYELMQQMASDYHGPHKIVVNRNPENLGITKHMNRLFLELAHGDIIIVAHGDDVSEANRTDVLVNYLNSHPECMQVASSAIVCDSHLKPLAECHQRKIQVSEERVYLFFSGAHVAIGFSAFRKKVMEFFGPLNDDCPTEDDPVGFRSIMLGSIALLPDLLVRYRKHEGSMSNPEKFIQFPLEKILEQQIKDMTLANNRGIINSQQVDIVKNRLYKGMQQRKVYRVYFAKRTISSLIKLISYPGITMRRRISYIKEHLEYILFGAS